MRLKHIDGRYKLNGTQTISDLCQVAHSISFKICFILNPICYTHHTVGHNTYQIQSSHLLTTSQQPLYIRSRNITSLHRRLILTLFQHNKRFIQSSAPKRHHDSLVDAVPPSTNGVEIKTLYCIIRTQLHHCPIKRHSPARLPKPLIHRLEARPGLHFIPFHFLPLFLHFPGLSRSPTISLV